jgi:hypothetical protein
MPHSSAMLNQNFDWSPFSFPLDNTAIDNASFLNDDSNMNIFTSNLSEPLCTSSLNNTLPSGHKYNDVPSMPSPTSVASNFQLNLTSPFAPSMESPKTSTIDSDYASDSHANFDSNSDSSSDFSSWKSKTQFPTMLKSRKSKRSRDCSNECNSTNSQNTTKSTASCQKQKCSSICQRQTHAAVEERYRRTLLDEMHHLQMAVPPLAEMTRTPTKATIISTAVQYIKSLERERDALLRTRIRNRARNVRRDH